ncbi:MAG: acetylxylan esterase [Cyclobacteriaceae bacterium]|nr:acetylxylan esterase [Cyclobacteriaceae bacterium]
MKLSLLIVFVSLMLFLVPSRAQDISLFNYWHYYSDIQNALYKNHCHDVFQLLEKRKAEVDRIDTKEGWIERQKFIKDKMAGILRMFPGKTPLNPKITGIINRDGYRIEKIIYESLPGYYVTGAIYIPDGLMEKCPAIFYACGHSVEGFRVKIYQHVIVNLVKKGFVVFTIDPMGQGERFEYWNHKHNEPKFPIPDHEHSYAGAQCLMTGYSVASYFIWDVIRGLDYMVTRKEVDPGRIGMTGRSGGGNLTAYAGAIDDRIYAAAPECYITNYNYLCRSIGPQCAEQNLFKFVAGGLDHADFIVARAPDPTMIISTTRDFFSIQGTLESYAEARRIFEMMDSGERLTMVQDDAIHTSTRKNREAMYSFFQKYLDNPGDPADVEVDIPGPEELKVTETGQTTTFLGGETIFSLNKKIAGKDDGVLNDSRVNDEKHLDSVMTMAAGLSGFREPAYDQAPVFSGRYVDPDYTMEKFLVPGSGLYMLPVVLLKPNDFIENEIILMFDTEGMDHAVKKDSLVNQLLKQGYTVLLSDLPGLGSLGPGYLKGDSFIEGISYNQWFTAVLAGRSHVGLRSEDIVRIVRFIKNDLKIFGDISAISKGPVGSDLIHACTFEKSIMKICLVNPFLSFNDMINTRFYKPGYVPFTVAGTTGIYDLPDLMAALIPRKVLIHSPYQADGTYATNQKIQTELAYPAGTYLQQGLSTNFRTVSESEGREMYKEIIAWFQNQ